MAYFSYKALDQTGKTMTGLVEAPSDQVAARLLKEKKLYITNLKEQSKTFSLAAIKDKFKHISFNDQVNFTRQMSTLAVAGLSIPESLRIISSQTTNPALLSLYQDIEHSITGGGNFAGALARHPDIFSDVYIALVRAGEASGSLDRVLTRMAENLENQAEFRAKVRSAMIYPIIIIVGMIAVIFVMMTVVIPKLTELYDDFGIDLSITTKILVWTSDFFVNYWWLMILAVVVGIFIFVKWRANPLGRLILDKGTLKIPLLGELQTKVMLAEFTRALGMLIGSGIHILDALTYLKDSMGNVVYQKAVAEITKKIEKGFPMGESFAQYDIFPIIVSQMIKVGEETGKLDETLGKLSTYFERESDHLLKNLTTTLEPAIMIVLGLGVGFIVFSVITPIYSLTSQIK
jgi:type II secretory pathway component PulF